MAILIDKPMPKSCEECFAVYETEGCYHDYCQIAGYNTDVKEYIFAGTRPEWCPLTEVTE